MRDDLSQLRQSLLSAQRAAEAAGVEAIAADVKAAMEALDRIERQTKAYAALSHGLATVQSTRGIADLFVTFFTYIRQDLGLGHARERDALIYNVLDELYDTAKQLRR